MGIIGLMIFLTIYSRIIPRGSVETKDRKVGWVLYAVLYAFMLLYRTSCTNGLIELYVFTVVINNPLFIGGDSLEQDSGS